MSSLDQIQQDIQGLPDEAKALLLDFIEILKKRYLQSQSEAETVEASPYQKFKASSFIGCVSVEENLSTPYKQVLAEKWNTKHNHR